MNKTIALFAIAGLSMASEIDGFTDDNLSVFHPEQTFRRPIFTAFHTVDDELRILPIVDHPPRNSGPSKPIRADAEDDELRVLPIDYSTSSGSRPHIYYTDDELRILPIVDHPPRNSGPSKPIRADAEDDELRVLPIDYHPPRPSGPSKPIWTDDELRVLPIVYHPPSNSGSNRPIRADSEDDELRVLPIDYHPPRPSGPSKPIWTDDELISYNNGVYYGSGFRIVPAGNSQAVRNPHLMMADDELRTVPALATYILNRYGKKDTTISQEIANDDEYVATDMLESRLISVGAGSLARPKKTKNATETAKSVKVEDNKIITETAKPVKAEQEARLIGVGAGSIARPKKNLTEIAQPISKNGTKVAKPLPIRDLIGTPVKAADDELRFAHLFPRRPAPQGKKNTTKTTQEVEAADNSLSELSHLLRETRGKGFLSF